MEEQINRTILDSFDVTSVENHEIYKMNGSEVLKGLENGSLHFITVPREEFIDHTLLPEYISTHGFIIDTMLDSADGSNNETSQPGNASFVTQNCGSNLSQTNEIQLQTLDESDRRLNAALLQFVKASNIRLGGPNNSETQVIVTNKDLVSLSGAQVIDTSVKSDNSNSIDTSTFLTFDDQQSLTSSLINDGQFRIFQQPSPNNQQQQQTVQINSPNNLNNSTLPQLTPIRRLNKNHKTSISLNIEDQITIENLKNNDEIESIQHYNQKPVAKKVLPHKKRITKKLKSIDVNEKVDLIFQQPDNSERSPSSQIQYFQDLNEEINADEVISLNSPQFSCQLCGFGADSQLEFFSHLKLHYEPKSESPEISQITIINDESSVHKNYVDNQQQSGHQIHLNINDSHQTVQYQQLPTTKRSNQQLQQQKTHQNRTQVINENTQFQHIPDIRRELHQSNDINDLTVHHKQIIRHSDNEEQYLITTKKIDENRHLPDVTNFSFENFSQMSSLTGHSHSSHTVTTKDIINPTQVYEILDTSIENQLRVEDSQQLRISKQADYLSLQTNNNQHNISLPPRTLLNENQITGTKLLLDHQQNRSHLSTTIQQNGSNNIRKNHEQHSQNSQEIIQDTTIYNQHAIETIESNNDEQNMFQNAQYFETKFTGLPNQVLNLEQKIDAIQAENNIPTSHHNETMTQTTIICGTENNLHNTIQISNSETNEIDGTENITPSIGQLHNETNLNTNSQKLNTAGIVILQHDEVEFSDPEDMLEGIRGVVDKVQESFDSGDEMDGMSPPRANWFPNTSFNDDISSKSNNNDSSRFETSTSVENFQIFFKTETNKNEKQIESKINPVAQSDNSDKKPTKQKISKNKKTNRNTLRSTENSMASSTTNTVPSHPEIDNDLSIKMENFSSDFDSWSEEYEKSEYASEENVSKSLKTPKDDSMKSPSPPPSDKETLKNCGVLSGQQEKRKFYCEKCIKVFNSANALKYHEFSHSGKRPYPCEECGKSFYAQNALRAHLRVHSGEKPFSCVDCGRAFRQWGDLNYHRISLHSNEKNFQCEFCGKAFARNYSLVIHRRIHTQEKNYKCEFCPKTFRASSYLQNHRKVHTGEKPYECQTCNKKFRVCGDLRRHQKIHNRVANVQNPIEAKSKQKENQQITLDNLVSIQLSDAVIDIQPEEENTSLLNNQDKSIKNQTDLNSTVFMYTTDENLDHFFKTDNTNQIANLSSTLPINVNDRTVLTNGKNVSFTTSSESMSTTTTYIITEVTNSNKKVANTKIVKKSKGRPMLT